MFLRLLDVCLDARQLARSALFGFGFGWLNDDASILALFFESIVCAAFLGRFPLSCTLLGYAFSLSA